MRMRNLSCRWIQMEQAPLANKPDLTLAVRDYVSDLPNEQAFAVCQVMSKVSRCWIKTVETRVSGPKPQMPTTVASDTVDRITDKAFGVAGVVTVAGEAFGSGIKFICSARARSKP